MIRIYFLSFCLLLGSFLNAQALCTDFNSSMGNWKPGPSPNDRVAASLGSPNTLDGSQYVILKDLSGGSWFSNLVDFKNIGQRFVGQCLYFDFYLVEDGGYNRPIHPTIYVLSGNRLAVFTANITVPEGSGWVRVKAPIALASGSTLPSSPEGSWSVVSPGLPSDFNDIMNNSTGLMVSPDYTSSPSEVVLYDNICIKSCEKCSADFTLSTLFSTTENTAAAYVMLDNNNPASTYSVNWGDGLSGSILPTHLYSNPGSYKVCVSEFDKNGKEICRKCILFCYSKDNILSGKSSSEVPSGMPDLKAISKAELGNLKNNFLLVPNPAQSYADIQMNLDKKQTVSVKLTDLSGRTVLEKSENLESGRQHIRLNTEKLVGGTYITEVQTEGTTSSQKLIITQ